MQEEELEAQVSFLQGQLNDLEAMYKYCAKMMSVHIGEFNNTPPTIRGMSDSTSVSLTTRLLHADSPRSSHHTSSLRPTSLTLKVINPLFCPNTGSHSPLRPLGKHARTLLHSHAGTHTHSYAYTRTHTRAHTHTHTHTRTHTHAYTHTRAHSGKRFCFRFQGRSRK